jgi:cobalt/nickel transport system permease protein
MHANFIDPFHSGDSPLHHLDARVKLLLTVGYILTVSLMPPQAWPGYILLFSLILSVAILSDLGSLFAVKRAFLVVPFILAALPVLFTTEGDPLFSITLGRFALSFTEEGLVKFASIILKSWLSIQAGILLTATTPFPRLLMAMRALRVPRLLVSVFSLMWRYLFLLVDEAMRLMRAREARSGSTDERGGGSVLWRARVTGSMAGSLFLRGYERSERVYDAMLARGYDGEIRTLPVPPLSARERLVLALGVSILGFLLLLEILVW